MEIFSKKNPKKLLGKINRFRNVSYKRNNISPPNQFLQVSTQKLKRNDFINPHIHLKNQREIKSTQETWIILKGEVLVEIYDIDKKKIKKFILKGGDIYILFSGGHSFKVLSKETIFYEIKNGPYKIKKKDIYYLNK